MQTRCIRRVDGDNMHSGGVEMKNEKLFTRKAICEIVGATYHQVNYAIQSLQIKPVEKVQLGGKPQFSSLYSDQAVEEIKQKFIKREQRQAIAETKRREKRLRLDKPAPSQKVRAIPERTKKTQATIDADKGQHDTAGTEWLIACDKYQRKNNVWYMRKSDYFAFIKSMGLDWLENLLILGDQK